MSEWWSGGETSRLEWMAADSLAFLPGEKLFGGRRSQCQREAGEERRRTHTSKLAARLSRPKKRSYLFPKH